MVNMVVETKAECFVAHQIADKAVDTRDVAIARICELLWRCDFGMSPPRAKTSGNKRAVKFVHNLNIIQKPQQINIQLHDN